MPSVSEHDVRHLARLAHLALSDAEVRDVTVQLDRLLAYVAQIQAIDVTGASETIHVGLRATPLRPDVARPGLPRPLVTAAAPAAPAGLFEVPKVLDVALQPSASERDDDAEEP
jgi:aspartyl-tRNA(Asn)/glutamyl-tRNA(Gln) amidotransferase subunit C